MTTPTNIIPRNKNGKTNNGTPYRYAKAVKSKSLKSSAVDLSVLNKSELKLMEILKRDKTACIPDLQDEIFTTKSYELYGTSDTRNLLRRVGTNATGSKLIERVPGERGYYRLTTKGSTKLAEFKKSGKTAKAAPKKKAKAAPKKKALAPDKKKTPTKKRGVAKKTTKTVAKKKVTAAKKAA
jgi:hypothetical protein